MNMTVIQKAAAQLCVSALFFATLVLPLQASEVIPVPNFKPVLLDGVEVPYPSHKPVLIENEAQWFSQSSETKQFEAMSLNLASLFSVEETPSYAHSYKPLSGKNAKLYQEIFSQQTLGDWQSADALMKKLTDDRLIGHVLSQRYLHENYRTSFKELQSWLSQYSDHPYAQEVYKLAISRRGDVPENQITLPKKERILSQVREPKIVYPKHYIAQIERSVGQNQDITTLSRKIRALVRTGRVFEAMEYYNGSLAREYLDRIEKDQIEAQLAAGLMYARKLDAALDKAVMVADRSGKYVPEASWIAGLVYWQMGEFGQAIPYFEKAGRSVYASGWHRAAGLFWAARSYNKIGDKTSYNKLMSEAAQHSRTFYGLLASRALGTVPQDFNWEKPEFTKKHEALILSQESGQRVLTLVAAQQYDIAESELLRMDYKSNPQMREAVLAYAMHVGLSGIALRLGNMVQDEQGRYYDSAAYPLSAWQPEDGYSLDPALVHAVMRQESRFDLNAKSYSGALGLMQVMPQTAAYIADRNGYGADVTEHKICMPEKNMKLGQDYIEYLFETRIVGGDVVGMLIAYNAGPGNLQKWRKKAGNPSDPLLLIETLPVEETRDYVERVLSNYWIYRMRTGQDIPSLAALARGKSPKYAQNFSIQAYQLASN